MTTQPDANPNNLPPHRKVRVDLGPRSYDVVIGRGLLDALGSFLQERKIVGTPVIITDQHVGDLYFRRAKDATRGHRTSTIAYRFPGESSKSLETYGAILSDLANERISRSGTIIALGGGVIGDLAGFVAATYKRGINFVQVPTSLLAMVDSSVGGKTGVNLSKIKNIVGAFYQPKLVVADLDTLSTLPPREFAAGMAEVIKYGVIADEALFDRVAKGVTLDDSDLDEIIEKCVEIKAQIVQQDEFEEKGLRALLNFGHTLGHAIEKAIDIRQITKQEDSESSLPNLTSYIHGEAISLGMRAAAWLSVWREKLPESAAIRIEKALNTYVLPLKLDPHFPRALIHSSLGNDKKVALDGKIRWVLLDKLGHATPDHVIPLEDVERAIDLLYTEPIWSK